MSSLKIRTAIATAFAALERASDKNGTEASGLFRKAFDAALDGERAHRRMRRGLGGYRQGAETAARYFVVKWFRDARKVKSARDAAALRLDCLYASALHDVLLEQMGMDFIHLAHELDAIAAIDYTSHIVSAA